MKQSEIEQPKRLEPKNHIKISTLVRRANLRNDEFVDFTFDNDMLMFTITIRNSKGGEQHHNMSFLEYNKLVFPTDTLTVIIDNMLEKIRPPHP
jgi:hypothetical protein